jgi:hypothetical protein
MATIREGAINIGASVDPAKITEYLRDWSEPPCPILEVGSVWRVLTSLRTYELEEVSFTVHFVVTAFPLPRWRSSTTEAST